MHNAGLEQVSSFCVIAFKSQHVSVSHFSYVNPALVNIWHRVCLAHVMPCAMTLNQVEQDFLAEVEVWCQAWANEYRWIDCDQLEL